jgi:DNA repair protein RadC
MHDIQKIEDNRMIRAMLWNPEQILPSLYELRNRELISKVSEIDDVRQFTTRYTLAEVVERIIVRGEGT